MDIDPIVQQLTKIATELAGVKARQNIMITIGVFALGTMVQFAVWTNEKFEQQTNALHGIIIRIERLEHNNHAVPQSMREFPQIWLPAMPYVTNTDRRKIRL